MGLKTYLGRQKNVGPEIFLVYKKKFGPQKILAQQFPPPRNLPVRLDSQNQLSSYTGSALVFVRVSDCDSKGKQAASWPSLAAPDVSLSGKARGSEEKVREGYPLSFHLSFRLGGV